MMSGAPAGDEQYFPRGCAVNAGNDKKDLKARKERKRAEKRRENDDFFKVLNAPKKSKKGKKPKNAGGENSKADAPDAEADPMEDFVIEPLTQKTIQTGMVVLGAIHHIYGRMARVALPGVIADLPLGSVSAAYTTLVESWTRVPTLKNQKRTLADAPLPEKLAPFDELFRVGQVLKFAVQMTRPDKPPVVSTVPEDVNGGLSRDQLCEGMVLQAAISSIEDHGYALETGIDGLGSGGAFLAAKDAPRTLHVGELILVRVERKSQTDRLKFLPYAFEQVVEKGEQWNLNTLMPGMVLKATIVQCDPFGLGLWLLNSELMGAIEPRQIPRGADAGSQLSLQSQISAVVLYKHPILNTLYCSLRIPPVNENDPFGDFHGVRLGQIIEKAVIVEVTSAFVRLEVPLKKKKREALLIAVATKENTCDDETKEPSDVFSPGQITSCRVIGLSLLERELYVSLRESVVEHGKYYTEDELVVGKTASAVANAKNAGDLFPTGKPVHIRIRYINGKHYPKRYFVTCNRQLVKSKREVIATYETCHAGKIADGVVLMVRPRGLLVGFYNKIRGWVPEEYLPSSNYARADEVYKVGQVVTTKVISVNPDAERMTLSLRVNVPDGEGAQPAAADKMAAGGSKGTEPVAGARAQNKKEQDQQQELVTDITATVIKKDRHCLELDAGQWGPCLLSWDHLSDFSDLSRALFCAISPGSELSELTCFGVVGGRKQLSMKPFVRSMALSGQLATGSANLGSLLPGVIKSAGPWGAVIALPRGQSAKVMLRDLADSYVPKDHACLAEGATLVCKVISTDGADDLVRVSCKASEVNYALDASYKESLATTFRTLLSFGGDTAIGQVIKVVPKKIKFDIICDHKGQRAIACAALTTDGQSVRAEPTNAIVLGYRFQDGGGGGRKDQQQLVVTVDRDVVYKYLQIARRHKKTNKVIQTKGSLHCKAEVLVLAVLRDYAAAFTKDGRLVMLTLGNHPNDIRRGHWTFDREDQRLPRVVEAYLYDTLAPANGAILVGNFCRAEGVANVDTHVIGRLGEEVEMIDDFISEESSNENELGPDFHGAFDQLPRRRNTVEARTENGPGARRRNAPSQGDQSSQGRNTVGVGSDNRSSSSTSNSEDGDELINNPDGVGQQQEDENDDEHSDSSLTKFDTDESGASDSDFPSEDTDD
ncbi:protein RRP5-like [Tropilaelaps mercedesae]|uniref:Protein RRP5-like n=1 Tax=Tropilaelaps mercedesae TaxID=418985 RepID=A0A1V9XMC2_9ACAR|nr:protein RRP5-like [Tropilaelaps mercedesae]